jgi:hypothetical protein
MSYEIAITKVTRVVVFVHPGQLNAGYIHLVALCDAQAHFEYTLDQYKELNAICVYDGPPMPKDAPILEYQPMEKQ